MSSRLTSAVWHRLVMNFLLSRRNLNVEGCDNCSYGNNVALQRLIVEHHTTGNARFSFLNAVALEHSMRSFRRADILTTASAYSWYCFWNFVSHSVTV
jgi:hypothetical protein